MVSTRTGTACCCVIVLALALTGCDAVGSEALTFSKEVDFRFEFSTNGTSAGAPLQADAVGSVDFADVLAPEGFSKEDVIAVTVRDVTVRRVTPAGTNLDVFERLAFTLTATGTNLPTIAETDAVPNAREADLDVRAPGITSAATRPTFRGRLIVIPAAAHNEQYVLSATMQVAVEVEGL